MKVTIIGAGKLGGGIGSRLVAGGTDVELIDRNPDDARKLADELGGAVAGKIVVDITNPADWSTMDRLVTPHESSAAEEIAKLVPGARVVKAFNTTFAGTLRAGEAGGVQLDVLIAGDDDDAKRTVASLVEAGGWRALDVGPLKRARQPEHVGLFHIAIQEQLGSGLGSALKLHW